MRKKIIIGIAVVLVLIVIIILMYWDRNPMRNGETTEITMNSEVIISGKTYKSNKKYQEYTEALRKIFKSLEEKYEWNPA